MTLLNSHGVTVYLRIITCLCLVALLSSCVRRGAEAPVRHMSGGSLNDGRKPYYKEQLSSRIVSGDKYGFSCPLAGSSVIRSNKLECEGGVVVESSRSNRDVVASLDGKVIYVGSGLRLYGNVIIIEHDSRVVTMYARLGNIKVKVGHKVLAGQKIGDVLTTQSGRSTLCFVPKHNDEYIKDLKQHINCR